MSGIDLTSIPLAGTNLVEASAGTGKTYSLTGLYLRLLLEQAYLPAQILVLTFTNAATAELKERIRRRLLSAREGFAEGRSDDPLIRHLLANLPDRQQVERRLTLALAEFDQAAIHTIHGYCQRVLTEHAFETSQPFEVELVPDQEARLQQIADDFWRTRLVELPERLLSQIGSPEQLLAAVRPGLAKPYLAVRGTQWPDDLMALESRLEAEIRALQQTWRSMGKAVCDYLSDASRFNQTRYKRQNVIGWCGEMTHWLADPSPGLEGFPQLQKFSSSSVAAGLRKGQSERDFELFRLTERIVELMHRRQAKFQQAIGSIRLEFFHYLCAELPRRQQLAGEWSYDDLLQHLDQALSDSNGVQLARQLSRRYPAALVDEFQDTDPIQYRILKRIYAGGSKRALFLVGDPKQAIYSFRGADIFAYLEARKLARGGLSLETNWRSSAELIKAINSLFGANPRAFFYPQIDYRRVKAAPGSEPGLREKGDKQAPFRIWQLSFGSRTPLPEVRQRVADAVANEILRLLMKSQAGRLTIDSRPVEGSDLAVLVRTHQQGEQIAAALLERGVLSVRSAQDDVFLSPEAEQLERLLLALLEPRREALLRAALSTELLGWDAVAIDHLNRDDRALSRQLERFQAYRETWRDAGFMHMFRQLISKQDVELRLLNYRDGERRLTNLYHLAELLHRQDRALEPGMEGLLKWFSHQRQGEGMKEEERQLRLESDSHLVKIVTLHASKGLQYPVVFCPFLWDGGAASGQAKGPYLYHDPEMEYLPVFELGSEEFDSHRRYLHEEELAENLRLLYVALTRAQFRCYMPWGRVKGSENSALAWLLHGMEKPDREPLKVWQAGFKKLGSDVIEQRLQQRVRDAGGQIRVDPLPMQEQSAQLALELSPKLAQARSFKGTIRTARRVHSFSSLTLGMAADLPDHDALSVSLEDAQQVLPDDIHGFPRGARPGTCLHSLFESLDFRCDSEAELVELVDTKLVEYGIERRWTPVVVKLLNAVLETPLNAEGLRLKGISNARRINEMEFHYPVRQLDMAVLRNLVLDQGFATSPILNRLFEKIEFSQLQGFLKGFIDLVIESNGRYYLLDYKSNWLGTDQSYYNQGRMQTAMIAHHYPFQYLFYVLALHRHLQQRLPDYDYERHFGDVYYLFLRGMKPETGPEFGVFQERPPGGFILDLDRHVAGKNL